MRAPVLPALLPVLALAAACAGGGPPAQPSPKQMTPTVPEWYSTLRNDPNVLTAATSATSRDLQLAVNKAQADARINLAQQLEVQMAGYGKRFQEETGAGTSAQLLDQYTQAYKLVVSQTLNGSRAARQQVVPEGELYRAYVLMEMNKGEATRAMVERIKADQAMYTRFRATQAFQEMEEEVAKYEAAKKAASN